MLEEDILGNITNDKAIVHGRFLQSKGRVKDLKLKSYLAMHLLDGSCRAECIHSQFCVCLFVSQCCRVVLDTNLCCEIGFSIVMCAVCFNKDKFCTTIYKFKYVPRVAQSEVDGCLPNI